MLQESNMQVTNRAGPANYLICCALMDLGCGLRNRSILLFPRELGLLLVPIPWAFFVCLNYGGLYFIPWSSHHVLFFVSSRLPVYLVFLSPLSVVSFLIEDLFCSEGSFENFLATFINHKTLGARWLTQWIPSSEKKEKIPLQSILGTNENVERENKF